MRFPRLLIIFLYSWFTFCFVAVHAQKKTNTADEKKQVIEHSSLKHQPNG
jgi:hypothetical protein